VAGKSIKTYDLEHLSKFRIGATTMVFTVTDNKAGESAPPPTLVARSRR